MNRNITLQEKIDKLVTNSFHVINNNITHGEQFTRENYENFREKLLGLMEFFENEKVYVMDLPMGIIPHPEARRRMVDPELINTPVSKSLSVIAEGFIDFYGLTQKITELLTQGREVFIYTIEIVRQFNPTSFEPTFRPIIRYNSIEMDYWYTQINNQTNIIPVRNQITLTIERETTEKKPKSVGDSKLKHNFNGDT